MATTTGTLLKWGNGQGLLLPKAICEKMGLHIGDKLEIEVTGDAISVKPQARKFSRTKRYTIDELFKDYEGTYEPPSDWPLNGNEIDWGKPQGKEIW